jgi:Ca2+-binding EF-hand superfamily protein
MMKPHPTVVKMRSEIDTSEAAVNSILTSAFKKKCEDMFKEADKNGDGSLDASELRAFAAASLPECVDDPLFYEAFDVNGDQKLDVDEFEAMMIYFEMKKRKMSQA